MSGELAAFLQGDNGAGEGEMKVVELARVGWGWGGYLATSNTIKTDVEHSTMRGMQTFWYV